ncbi:MAG TPA: response regulator [Opitutales bacterium]|nr:response regulator [Opitutales bacterium]
MGKNSRLLLVDDDDVFRKRLARAMTHRGYEVKTAGNGGEALEVATDFEPQFAVFDLRMPDENGLQVVEKLRAILPDLRIVMLTGYGSIATAVEALRLGAADYLTKPADGDQIDRALQNVKPDDLAKRVADDVPSLDRVEWEHLQRVLADCNHNISQAARLLKIDRRSLQRKLKKYPPSGP